MKMVEEEQIKKDLADAYKILAKLGMDDHTYTHLSARPKDADFYYIFPFGYRFEEVTPECLLKVSLDGKVLEGHEYQYNKTGYVIHGSIYKARQELTSIFHLHTIATVAVSAMKDGLLPISQWALHFYDQISYHEYNSLVLDEDTQGQDLVKDMGDKKIMFLRNHGFIACGRTICEAMFYCYHLENACKTQIATLSCNQEVVTPDKEICKKANSDLLNFEKNLGMRDWKAWVKWIENNTK
ncbi:class II aldolase/adducin family protein [Rickettsiaceae bacterium]|nr:class II aldolase/adducin family protein [Rickettsiaceae bacterium]